MKTLYNILLTIALCFIVIDVNAQAQNCCSVTCVNGSCEAYGSTCVCTCSPNTGYPSCGSTGGRIFANPTQAENMLTCKGFCIELSSINGNKASEKYQIIYNLLEAHEFSIDNSTEDYQTILNNISELTSIITNNFSEEERNNLFNFISSLSY